MVKRTEQRTTSGTDWPKGAGGFDEQIIAPLLPSAPSPRVQVTVPPLPLADVTPHSTGKSTRYGIASVDDRGRVADSSLVLALQWQPGDPLSIDVLSGSIVIRSDRRGLYTVARRGNIPIPARIRQRCGLSAGDRVLLVAMPDFATLVVHPRHALDAMVLAYHALLGEQQEPI